MNYQERSCHWHMNNYLPWVFWWDGAEPVQAGCIVFHNLYANCSHQMDLAGTLRSHVSSYMKTFEAEAQDQDQDIWGLAGNHLLSHICRSDPDGMMDSLQVPMACKNNLIG